MNCGVRLANEEGPMSSLERPMNCTQKRPLQSFERNLVKSPGLVCPNQENSLRGMLYTEESSIQPRCTPTNIDFL